jgi:hypothetical protein
VIPALDCDVSVDARVGQSWLPEAEDVWSADGYGGGFHDSWSMAGASYDEAEDIIRLEDRFLKSIDAASSDAATYEAACQSVEFPDDDMSPLRGLELGVAGIVYALNAAGMPTAASSRWHDGGGWSPYPVVYFVAENDRAMLLVDLIDGTKCGFCLDDGRLYMIWAASVTSLHEMARRLVAARGRFQALGAPFYGDEPPDCGW